MNKSAPCPCGAEEEKLLLYVLTKYIHYNYNSYMKFIWDESKNRDNILNHKISFEEAQTVFYDPNGKLITDPDHSGEEDRFIFLGLSRALHLFVFVIVIVKMMI